MPLLGENQKESESAFYRDAYTPVCCCAGHNSQEAEPEMEPVHPQTNWGRGGGGEVQCEHMHNRTLFCKEE